MAVSVAQYNKLLERLTAVEEMLNDHAVAISNLATVNQMQAIAVILQQAVADLTLEVEALAARVTAIEEEPLR